MELLYHLRDFSSWGFSEVILKIPFYIKALNVIEKEVEKRNCKVAILIDFQDFNLRLAKRLSKKGVQILYYVAPQAWVWKAWRTKVLQETVHTLFAILPFEKKWFMDRGVKCVRNIPHPVWSIYKERIFSNNLEKLKKLKKDSAGFKDKLKLLLLPGSRNFEVINLLPVFYQACLDIKNEFNVELAIVYSPSVDKRNYVQYLDIIDHVYRNDELYLALESADIAIAASGTVTLTTALFEVPTVVCYKTSLFNEMIYNLIVNYKGFVSLCNIVHEEKIFPEFVQSDFNVKNIVDSVFSWAKDGQYYCETVKKLSLTKDLLKGDQEDVSSYIGGVINSVYEN